VAIAIGKIPSRAFFFARGLASRRPAAYLALWHSGVTQPSKAKPQRGPERRQVHFRMRRMEIEGADFR
jgi:hypothetical protein